MSKSELIIRQETEADHSEVFNLIEAAFKNEEISDHKEHFLVDRLRKSKAFVPELSLVAELDNQLVGHILLTKLVIKSEPGETQSLALAPVSVLPEFQHQGIGGKLIRKAHEVAQSLGFKSVLLLGHPEYYPRFGYQKASSYGIQFPFEAPDEACMALELHKDSLQLVSGTVRYPKEFFL